MSLFHVCLPPVRKAENHQKTPASLCAGRELNPGYELGKLMSYH